jgi:hypothetical protein
MTTLTLVLPKPHSGQRAVLREAQRYNVLACGRRWGKSTLALDLATRPMLAGQPIGYFAPTYKLLKEFWRQAIRILRPVLRAANASDHRAELITGGALECWTLEDPDAGRSRRYQRVIIDEAGLVPTLGDIWQAAIRPTLADLEGDAWLMGTPKGRNYFYTAYMRGLQGDSGWAAWQRPTSDNPHIVAIEIEAMRQELSERRYAQEIEAQFLEDGGGVFRGVRACVGTAERSPQPCVIGADWGRSHDYTVFVAIDPQARAVVEVDRFTGIEYEQASGRLRALWERTGRGVVVAESNSMGQPIIEQLQRSGMPVYPFLTTNASKANIIDGLALAFERQQILIPDLPWLVAELEAFEGERLPSGLIRYGAPEQMHDDGVMALAIAYASLGRPSAADLVDYA